VNNAIAYFDCFSGASGNMLLGALLDAGLPPDDLRSDTAKLGITDFHLHVERQVRHGISGTFFDVHDDAEEPPLRNLAIVEEIIESSSLSVKIQERSTAVFTRLAEAEACIHGVPIAEIHFHEIGAIDTLVDIVGVIAGLERLGISQVYASALPAGRGSIMTQHGRLPVPAPATLALLAQRGAPLIPSSADAELVTPTGAALLAELAQFEQPAMRIHAVGYGFGSRELPWANMLRVWIGEPLAPDTARSPHHHHAHGGKES